MLDQQLEPNSFEKALEFATDAMPSNPVSTPFDHHLRVEDLSFSNQLSEVTNKSLKREATLTLTNGSTAEEYCEEKQ